MSQVGRRAFAVALGGLTLSPTVLAAATQEVQDTGSISQQTLAAILELRTLIKIKLPTSSREQRVVPLAMEAIWNQGECVHL